MSIKDRNDAESPYEPLSFQELIKTRDNLIELLRTVSEAQERNRVMLDKVYNEIDYRREQFLVA